MAETDGLEPRDSFTSSMSTGARGATTAPGVGTLLLGAVFVLTVAFMLIVPGPFDWHIAQPEAWQGLLEALALVSTLFAALQATRLPSSLRLGLLALPAALYLRRHHVDGALLISLVYVEALLAIGWLLRRIAGGDEAGDWKRNLIAGLAAMSVLLWLAQALGFGLPRAQRLLAIAVMLPALWFGRRALLSPRMLAAAWRADRSALRLWSAIVIAIVLVSFARTNVVTGFDSLWYGLRPERVLVGARSVFEPLGFASPVYYFPKLYEVLLLPLSAMREDSVVCGVAIWLGALLGLLSFDLLRRLQIAVVPALAAASAIWTIPALAAATLTTKPDVLVALLVGLMVWFGWNISHGQRAHLFWVLAAAALAVSSKLLAVPYVGAAGLGALIAWFRAGRRPANSVQRDAMLALAMAALAASFAATRTWIVAGMPTIGPEQLVWLWQTMGMRLHPPIGSLSWLSAQSWSEWPSLAAGWLVDPIRFTHIAASWPSNLWVFLPVLALYGRVRNPSVSAVPWLLWIVPATGLALILGIAFMNPGGDGNYFIAPVLLASVAGMALASRRCGSTASQRGLVGALALYVAFHFSYAFVSTDWVVGTRTWDLDFTRSNRDSVLRNTELLAAAKLDGVAHWLHGQGGRLRVVGVVGDPVAYRLPARYEELYDVAISHQGVADLATMQHLLGCGRVTVLLLPHDFDSRASTAAMRTVAEWAQHFPASRNLYLDAHWRLIDLRERLPACD